MVRDIKRIICAIIVIVLLLSVPVACGAEMTAGEVVGGALPSISELPSGRVYDSRQSGEHGITSELQAILFGADSADILGEATEYAVFLPDGTYPCEVGVFFCSGAESADDIALVCCRRTDLIKSSAGDCGYGREEISSEVAVLYAGGRRAVVYAVGRDAEEMVGAVKHAMK